MRDESSNNKVVRLDARGVRPPLTLPPEMGALSQRAWQVLSRSFESLVDNVDDAFFELADRAETSAEQNEFFEAMREVRVSRPRLEQRFREELSESFRGVVRSPAQAGDPSSDLQLVEYEDVEEQIAVESMATRAEKQHPRAMLTLVGSMTELATRGGVEASLNAKNVPLGPLAICQSFAVACTQLDMPIKPRLVLFKLFERHVVANFAELYLGLETVLNEQGALVEPPVETRDFGAEKPPPARSEAPNTTADTAHQAAEEADKVEVAVSGKAVGTVFDILKQLLQKAPESAPEEGDGARAGTAEGNTGGVSSASLHLHVSRSALLGVLQELQSTQLQRLGSRAAHTIAEDEVVALSPEVQARLDQLRDKPAEEGESTLEQRDFDIINLVSLLFQYILEDDNLASPMKGLISHLQIPVLKVAMQDKSFFHKDGHPARKLLNRIADACIGWSPSIACEEEPLYLEVETIVKRVLARTQEAADGAQVFQEALDEFNEYLDEEQRRAEKVTRRMLDIEDSRAAADQARAEVDRVVEERLGGQDVPAPLAAMIRDGWSKVLFLHYAQEGPDSEAWQESLSLMDRALWSVQPVENARQREQLLRELPDIVEGLRSGLNRVGFNPFDLKQLMHELESIHLQCLKNAPSSGSVAEPASEQPAGAGSGEELETLDADLAQALGEEGASQARSSAEALIARLRVGVWVEFLQSDNKKLRCRLAAVIASTGRHIFVNRSGVKVADYERDELVDMLLASRMELLDDGTLFDRALESVISNLREMKDKPD